MRNVDRSLPVALFAAVLATALPAHAFSTGIASTAFGSLGCNTCHGGGATPTVTLTGPISVASNSANQYTFQISAVGAQNEGGLNVAATDGVLAGGGSAANNTQAIMGKNGLAEITHTSPKAASGGFVTFSFLWTAPSGATTVTLNAWGNAVDGDGSNQGDKAALATLTVSVGSPSPTPTPGCAPTPLPSCREPVAPGASTLQVKTNANNAKDVLTWNWNKGAATALSDFGDPVNGTTSYEVCVYDESTGVPAVVMDMATPPGGTCAGKPCWAAQKNGFLYKDKTLTNDGLMQLQLTQGVAGKAKIVVKGKGANLPVPAPVGPGLFAQDTAVIVQVVNSDGTCWEADFSAPAKKNDITQFNDKSD